MKARFGYAARSLPARDPMKASASANQARIILCSFPEVTQCTSQVGRPDDGTDTTGFFNTEYFVGSETQRSSGARRFTRTRMK